MVFTMPGQTRHLSPFSVQMHARGRIEVNIACTEVRCFLYTGPRVPVPEKSMSVCFAVGCGFRTRMAMGSLILETAMPLSGLGIRNTSLPYKWAATE
jgi:hypothetical protein